MGIIAEALKPGKVVVQRPVIHCLICGRQIVSYYADSERYVGPASEGCLCLVGGYACPPCTREEQKLTALGYYGDDGVVSEETIY